MLSQDPAMNGLPPVTASWESWDEPRVTSGLSVHICRMAVIVFFAYYEEESISLGFCRGLIGWRAREE